MTQFVGSQLLATSEAPYIKYLEKIKYQWDEAGVVERNLKTLATVVKRCHIPLPAGTPPKRSRRSTVAEILDIQADARGHTDSFKTPISSLEACDGTVVPSSTAIDNFLHQLQCCGPNVHTRIIVLHSGRTKAENNAFDTLFFCHVLGVELDLSPTDVRHLAHLDFQQDGPMQAASQTRPLLSMKPGFVSLGFTDSESRNRAAYLGRRTMGNASPQIVVVRLRACDYTSPLLASASAGIMGDPPSRSGSLSQLPIIPTADVFFRRAVRHCLQSASPLAPNDVTASWLSALAYMDAVKCSYSFHHLLTSWQCVFKSELSIEDMYRLSHSARMTCVSLQTSISQVAAFHRSFPAARRSDSDEASHFLERLLGEAKPLSGEIQASINTQQQRDQHEETRLAIGESKNTIALTILAFVFIPINTASSIFGMNVTEIGDSASIWVFVIVACALSVCSAIGWFLWRQMGWFKELGQNWGEKFGIRKESEKVGAYI